MNFIRIVRVGVIQNQIVLPTTAPLADQRNAIYQKISKIISLAAEANVNVLCLQEAWRKTAYEQFIHVYLLIKYKFFSNALCVLYKRKISMV